MFRFLRILIILVLILFWFVIVLPYFLLQTEFGAKYAAKAINSLNSTYLVSVGKLSHSLSNPYQIGFERLTIRDKQDPNQIYLQVNQANVELDKADLWQLSHFKSLYLELGEIHYSSIPSHLNSDLVGLRNISLLNSKKSDELQLGDVSGQITHWDSIKTLEGKTESQFQFTVREAQIDGVQLKNIYVKGDIYKGRWRIPNFGADADKGVMTANLSYKAGESLIFNNLSLNHFSYQTNHNFDPMSWLPKVPRVHFKNTYITQFSIMTPTMSIEQGNLVIKDLDWFESHPNFKEMNFSFDAENVIIKGEEITVPLLEMHSEQDQVVIDYFLGQWRKGDFKISGSYRPKQNHLVIDLILGDHFRYELPDGAWSGLSMFSLPDYIKTFEIERLSINSSILINTDEQFPFEFSQLSVVGSHLTGVNQDTLSIQSGKLSLQAERGTLNKVNVKKPEVTFNYQDHQIQFDFNAFIHSGMIEAKGEYLNQRLQNLDLSAHQVNSELLSIWQLVKEPVSANYYQLKLKRVPSQSHSEQSNPEQFKLEGSLQVDGEVYPVAHSL